MADISKCKGTGCHVKDYCYRYTARDGERQAWMTPPLILYDDKRKMHCDQFWSNCGKNLKKLLK